ncbi:S8 family serine peptidase [Kibdelosporangium persicum]|uniref:Secreted peptidase n=1 Tax=Kibdelosporangium persicum TaxID=2698649 RepID=A0ABX2F6R7_9PSEU|nr:S8 family serine peptidase [Kibdelosporangium persicum]NRN66480.1 Secreted peptidase [Kibdelosporangium persicum]
MRSRRALSGLLALVMAAAVSAAPSVAAGPVVAAPLGAASATVTLLTGDTITVSGRRVVDVRPAPGRERLLFESYTDERGDLNVIPEDAQDLLQKGTLDPRLFNVTDLIAAGLDDASADRLPLIVDYAGTAPRSAAAHVTRELPAVSATAVSVARSAAYWPVARTADRVWLDGRVRVALEHSVPQVGAPTAWKAGHTGAGTKVAVLDTGIDATHPDLAGAVADARDFTGGDNPDDRHGHGTHVASIVTGEHARYRGVAPDTRILNAKVMGDDGFGHESAIIEGMQWAANQGADVVNMSISGDPSDGTDPLSQAVNRLTAETGTLFVVAAGNYGYVGLPGAADAALTVGAVDRTDTLAEFSGRGPRFGDSAVKPDITAPGVDITAARAAQSTYGEPGQSHIPMSGTSMAAPHVAGAAAILAGQHPDWTAERLKATLMGSATAKDGLTVFEQGAGRVDLGKAVASTTSASPASLNFGLVRWPYQDTDAITKTLTYTNQGTAPVTFTLAADIKNEDGSPAPQGMFTITPALVTVPAGGQTAVTVTADVGVNGPAGAFSGTITATAGATVVRTPIAVHREVESYDVDLSAIAHDGTPSVDYRYRFVPINEETVYKAFVTGPTTVRLPAGEYTYTGFVRDSATGRRAYVVEPTFTVSGNTSLVFDAREAVPVDITVDDPSARDVYTQLDFERTTNTQFGLTGESVWEFAGELHRLTVRPSTTSHKDFTFTMQTTKAKWNGQSFDGSPYLYHLKHTDHAIPRTPRWHDRTGDLAKVQSEHASTTPGSTGVRDRVAIPLPGTLTEYYTPDVPWAFRTFTEKIGDEWLSFLTQYKPMVFPRGKITTVRWNHGVFSPSLSDGGPGSTAFRGMDQLHFQISPLSDQEPGRAGELALTGRTQLLRDGEVIGESEQATHGVFEVGPERAQYTARTTADRSAYAGLTTRYEAEWTFSSQRGERPTEATFLPLLAVRFTPDLDNRNAAPAGRPFRIPVSVQRNGSTTPGNVSTPAVEVSYDDGKTWTAARVHRDRTQWTVTVHHPAGAKFVSLRSAVNDPDGNAHRQTIIRAYALK